LPYYLSQNPLERFPKASEEVEEEVELQEEVVL
jgi:hypothetical protein